MILIYIVLGRWQCFPLCACFSASETSISLNLQIGDKAADGLSISYLFETFSEITTSNCTRTAAG